MEGVSNGSECAISTPSRRYRIVQRLLDRLVDETNERIERLADRFSQENVLSSLKKETALERCYDSESAAKLVFAGVLRTIARDDSAFDRLITILQEEGFEDLAGELSQKALSVCIPATATPSDTLECSPPRMNDTNPKLKRGMSWHGYTSGGASPFPEADGENEEPDSGIASRNNTGLRAQLSENSEPHLPELINEHFGVPKLLSASLGALVESNRSRIHPPDRSLSNANEQGSSISESVYNNPDATHTERGTTNQEVSTLIQVHEPRSHDVEEHQAPIQEHMSDSNPHTDVIILPEGDRLFSESTSIDVSDNDLVEKLRNMRLELQQMRAEGMQKNAENVVLQDKCKELEEKVEKMSKDLREQKEHTEQALKERDDAIRDWTQRYNEKAGEVERLRLEIAEKEKAKDKMEHQYKDEIKKLNAQHKQTIAEHKKIIKSLEKDLQETKQKKENAEIELAQAKQELCKAELQKVQEEMKVKDAMHVLRMEAMELKVALSSTKQELAEERQAKSERDLNDHRRQSVQLLLQLQDKDDTIEELKKVIEGLTCHSEPCSTSDKDLSEA